MKPIYIAHAYRWAKENEHHYIVAASDNYEDILKAAEQEFADRGSLKYSIRISKYTDCDPCHKPETIIEIGGPIKHCKHLMLQSIFTEFVGAATYSAETYEEALLRVIELYKDFFELFKKEF